MTLDMITHVFHTVKLGKRPSPNHKKKGTIKRTALTQCFVNDGSNTFERYLRLTKGVNLTDDDWNSNSLPRPFPFLAVMRYTKSH